MGSAGWSDWFDWVGGEGGWGEVEGGKEEWEGAGVWR